MAINDPRAPAPVPIRPAARETVRWPWSASVFVAILMASMASAPSGAGGTAHAGGTTHVTVGGQAGPSRQVLVRSP